MDFSVGGTQHMTLSGNGLSLTHGTDYIYTRGGFTWNGATTEYITRSTNTISFYTGSTHRASINATSILGEEGNNSTPGFSFVADPDTGMYRSSANQLGFSFGGTARVYMSNAGLGSIDADLYTTGDIEAGGDIKHNGSLISSDLSLKTNINDSSYGLAVINKLKPKKYIAKYDNKIHLGLIAQDVKKLLPDLDIASGKEGSLALRYEELTAILIKSVQELKKEIDELKENK